MSEHTPGPWIRQGQWNTNRGIAECIEAKGWGIIGAWIDISNEVPRNIDLIAAAPELLEVCGYLLDLCEKHRHALPADNENESKEWIRSMQLADAAIAKATPLTPTP